MLATLIDEPFDNDDWIFEVKWDGYRAIANSKEMLSRAKNPLNHKFPLIAKELKAIPGDFIIDGEVVIIDENGKANFQLIQNYQKSGTGTLYYYAFDLLYLNGKDLTELPLLERKEELRSLLKHSRHPHIIYSDHIIGKGKAFFKEAQKLGLEGIMGKKSNSPYVQSRSSEWVKIKTKQRQEVIIGGYTEPRGGRSYFGALLVGLNKKGKLHYSGHVGTGFNETTLKSLYGKMAKLKTKECPFINKPKPNAPVIWIKPKLICEVAFQEWTEEGIMRQPSFQGLREDKKTKEVIHEAEITHPTKIYFPKEKISKGEVIEYYEKIAGYILPYLKNRPLVMRRFPDGIAKPSFVQKEAGHVPDFVETVTVEHEDRDVHYIVVNNKETLLYVANLGSIEMHPFNASIDHLKEPDYLVFDLDPEKISFEAVIKTAQTLHEVLDQFDIPNYCKTSGATGLHIYIPLDGKYDFEQTRQFAWIIASMVHEKIPNITSLERMPKKRQKKVYLDTLQNREMQTLAAAYSLRGKPGATVSTPLEWDEVKKGLDPLKFNINTLFKRLDKLGDIFKPVLGKGINMKKILKAIDDAG